MQRNFEESVGCTLMSTDNVGQANQTFAVLTVEPHVLELQYESEA